MATLTAQEAGGHPILAFLDMLAVSELGTALLSASEQGYNVIVGSTALKPILFHSYADHPRRLISLPGLGIKSTAAGRYQILARYYDHYRRQLGLASFSPANQDRIALQLIRECRAQDDILQGNIARAIHKCRSRWASLPGAGYGQPEHSLSHLLAVYERANGHTHTG